MNYKLVDRIIEITIGTKIVCEKNVTMSEDYFGDIFPKGLSFPNSLVLEAMASSASWLIFATKNFGVLSLLSSVEKADFYTAIRPGDRIVIIVELLSCQSNAAKFKAYAWVKNEKVADAIIILFLMKADQTGDLHDVFSSWIQRGINTYKCLLEWGK